MSSGRSLPLYQVGAFPDQPFGGNPAAVCLLDQPLSAEQMQKVAAEMNLSETAGAPSAGAGWEPARATRSLLVSLFVARFGSPTLVSRASSRTSPRARTGATGLSTHLPSCRDRHSDPASIEWALGHGTRISQVGVFFVPVVALETSPFPRTRKRKANASPR